MAIDRIVLRIIIIAIPRYTIHGILYRKEGSPSVKFHINDLLFT
jgi:hypothetical protein